MTTQAAPAEPNRVDKKKIWEALQPSLKTDENKVWGTLGKIKMACMTSTTMMVANVHTHSYSRRSSFERAAGMTVAHVHCTHAL